MCILSLALNGHPKLPFLLISNRDEYVKRGTTPLQIVQKQSENLVACFDLEGGGTWCAFNPKTFKFAILTNFHVPYKKPTTTKTPSDEKLSVNGIDPLNVSEPITTPKAPTITTAETITTTSTITNNGTNTTTATTDTEVQPTSAKKSTSFIQSSPQSLSRGLLILQLLLPIKKSSIDSFRPATAVYGNLQTLEFDFLQTAPGQIKHPSSLSKSFSKNGKTIITLSNSFINDFSWPKTKRLQDRFTDSLSNCFPSTSPEAIANHFVKLLDIDQERGFAWNKNPIDPQKPINLVNIHSTKVIRPLSEIEADQETIWVQHYPDYPKKKVVDFATRGQIVAFVFDSTFHFFYRPTFLVSDSQEFISKFSTQNNHWQHFHCSLLG